jgi:sulfonate transport system ATP-binding protein
MGKAVGIHLEIRGLQKRFGERLVIENIDLQVREGEFVAIVGRSGCGKSTLLRLIAGLETPTEGKITQDNIWIQGLNPAVRVMFQEPRLLPWQKVSDNVALGMDGKTEDIEERTSQILQQVGLEDYKDEWPAVLSGGQRQRVALARALVSRPRLLLLDEPLGALDALTRIEMQQLIEKLLQKQGTTALLVTHDVEEAVALADRVILLEEGEITLDLPIPLPRPRQRNSTKFVSLAGRILDRIMQTSANESSRQVL